MLAGAQTDHQNIATINHETWSACLSGARFLQPEVLKEVSP
jgi:hypothetical protein